jgi:positive regulator of sigma E activity
MTDLLTAFRPELTVLATALAFTALAFWLERGFRRRAERLIHQTDTSSHDAPRREKEASR